MQKVSIIGISGTGKTWFAKKLSEKLGIPIYHYDTICWKKDWQEEDEKIVGDKILEILEKHTWILEGFINPLAHERLNRSDIIFYVDYVGWRALFGAVQRYFQYKNSIRPELPIGCNEKLSFSFLKTIFLRKERKEIEKEITQFENKIIRFKSRKDTEKYLSTLP